MKENLANAIEKRVKSRGRGWVFSSKDFVSVAAIGTVHLVLHRLQKANEIRRLSHGIYEYPRYSEFLGKVISPDIDKVAHAISRKFGWNVYPSGESALNIIGVSTQVPARYEYLSNGANKSFSIGAENPTKLSFKHVSTKESSFKHSESATLVMAIKSLGAENLSDGIIKAMRGWLPNSLRKSVLKDARNVTSWIYDAIKKICGENANG